MEKVHTLFLYYFSFPSSLVGLGVYDEGPLGEDCGLWSPSVLSPFYLRVLTTTLKEGPTYEDQTSIPRAETFVSVALLKIFHLPVTSRHGTEGTLTPPVVENR